MEKTAREILREQGCPNFVIIMMDDEECEAMLFVKQYASDRSSK